MKLLTTSALAGPLIFGLFVAQASAQQTQQAPNARRAEMQQKREAMKKQHEERRAQRQQTLEEQRKYREERREHVETMKKAFEQSNLKPGSTETRHARRRISANQALRKLRSLRAIENPNDPNATIDEGLVKELEKHARRVAMLRRIQVLANEAHDKEAADRATKLLALEESKHNARLSKLAVKQQERAEADNKKEGE
ncbi:MAG: hypothetical protein IPJ88_14190 [Myxococcales bacterium]|nr:MAG: hypothetical protein IPJ88_14190 [Myxococcales bacterium]